MGGTDPKVNNSEAQAMRCDVMMHFAWPLHLCMRLVNSLILRG